MGGSGGRERAVRRGTKRGRRERERERSAKIGRSGTREGENCRETSWIAFFLTTLI